MEDSKFENDARPTFGKLERAVLTLGFFALHAELFLLLS